MLFFLGLNERRSGAGGVPGGVWGRGHGEQVAVGSLFRFVRF